MNTRRIPFQFSATDPLARQKELEKRFGLQPSCPRMYVDVNNPLSMGSIPKETSSPRLQHRVPIFADGYDQPIHSSSVDSMASVSDKKPNVRVIPIEIEGADCRSPRHRTYSGPAATMKDHSDSITSGNNEESPLKRLNLGDISKSSKPKAFAEPRVYNIPIQIEGENNVCKNLNQPKASTLDALKSKSVFPSANGCSLFKSSSKVKSSKNEDKIESESNNSQADPPENVDILLEKINNVLAEFKIYETGVHEFNGTSKDKQYRYLDEMLTRCMLKLDDVDTMGNEEIRLARKSAVKKIQSSIDLLENKANVELVTSVGDSEVQLTSVERSDADKNNCNDIEMKDNQVNDDIGVSAENANSCPEIKEMDLSVDDKENPSDVSNMVMDNDAKIKGVKGTTVEPSQDFIMNDVTEMSEMIKDKASENSNLCEIQKPSTSLEDKFGALSGIVDQVEDNHVVQKEKTSSLQQNSPEIEMHEVSPTKVNSAIDVCSSETLGSDRKTMNQNEVFGKTILNDVEMLDESGLTLNSDKVEETVSVMGTAGKSDVNKLNKVSDVEMDKSENILSKTSDVKVECEPVDEKAANHNCDCFKQNSDMQIASSPSPKVQNDTNMSDVAQSKICNTCESNLTEQDIKCQSEKLENSQNEETKNNCNNIS